MKNQLKSALSEDQIAAFRVFLAGLGRRKGQSLEELWLDRLARAGDIGTFMQIGANDGDFSDPVDSVIRRHGLTGVMVEPIPIHFERLRSRHAGRAGITLVNAAIAETAGEMPFFYLPPDDMTLPHWANGLGSFYRDVIASHADQIPGLDAKILQTTVPCITFAELLLRGGIPHPDLLMTDTEGYDYKILKQVDLPSLAPKVILFETTHLTNEERVACDAMMAANNYTSLVSNENAIAFRQDVAAKWGLDRGR